METLDMHELQERGASNHLEEMRMELFEKVNGLGIGAQGLGGLTTVLDVKVKDYPTHAANKPVAIIPNCSATRHIHFTLDGSGPAEFTPPDMAEWPEIEFELGSDVKKVNLDTLTPEETHTWKSGDTLLLSGKMLTGRDAAHKKLVDMIDRGEPLPVDFTNRIIYYVGPVDPVREEIVGPAGPTTATRMDKFTRTMLEKAGLAGMIGKAERGQLAIDAIRDNKAVSMIAVGGAAYLVAKAITKSTLLAFPELGMEAIYEFEVKDMPVTVSVDSTGESVHIEGPKIWSKKIAEQIAVKQV
jgi:fumarate hydratase class I